MKVILTEDKIRTRVRQLAGEINPLLSGRDVVVVGVLTGCLIFLADLLRGLDCSLQVGFVQARSYQGEATTAGPLNLDLGLLPALQSRDVLLVDDIFDSGQTLSRVVEEIQAQNARSLRSVVLLEKNVPRDCQQVPDHIGFQIPNEFVVGYGLDFDGRFRNLPCVAVLEPEKDLPPAPRNRELGA